MRIRCGTDLLSDAQWGEHISKKGFKGMVFHAAEAFTKYSGRLKSIYTIKEACFKALGILPDWKKVRIRYESDKPVVVLHDDIRPKDLVDIDCSVTHERGMTHAMVVILLGPDNMEGSGRSSEPERRAAGSYKGEIDSSRGLEEGGQAEGTITESLLGDVSKDKERQETQEKLL